MTDVYEFAEWERNKLVYDFATLTPEERQEKEIILQSSMLKKKQKN